MNAVVDAARAAIGAPFRLHGRDAATGLDCVGLVAAALRGGGFAGAVPAGYALRSGHAARVMVLLDEAGLIRVHEARAGDVLLLRSGPGQLHLAISTGEGVVHADASLRRVVERPGSADWPLIGIWRLAGAETR